MRKYEITAFDNDGMCKYTVTAETGEQAAEDFRREHKDATIICIMTEG